MLTRKRPADKLTSPIAVREREETPSFGPQEGGRRIAAGSRWGARQVRPNYVGSVRIVGRGNQAVGGLLAGVDRGGHG